jgi:DNA-binding NarL/FixJ family response regulator
MDSGAAEAETSGRDRLVADVYAAGRDELSWDELAARMRRSSGARALLLLRGGRVAGSVGLAAAELQRIAALPDPQAAQAMGYCVDSHVGRGASDPVWLVQRFSAPAASNDSLSPVLSHVARVLALHDREVRFAPVQQTLARALADQMPVAVFEIDSELRVRSLNEPARRLSTNDDRVSIRHGVLGFSAEGTHAQLRRCMASGDSHHVTSTAGSDSDGGLALCLRRSESGGWWLLALDPSRPPQPSLAEFRRRYGLSERESRLALEIACGASIPAAALRLGVAEGTLRSQLKSVFRKTETRSQAELVIRLHDDPAWFLEAVPEEVAHD